MTKTKAKDGFTLVELLIVIAIIAVLISLLLPALTVARRQSNSVRCMSNLRQIGQWGLMYAQEWNGVMPTSFIDANGFEYTTNATLLAAGGAYNSTAGGWDDVTTAPYLGTQTFWTEKAGPPYGLYILDPAVAVNSAGIGASVHGQTPLRCPEAYNSFPDDRNSRLGTNYALNEFLGGQEYYNGHGIAATPKLGNFAPTVYWFCDGGVRAISTSNPPFDFYFGIMQLGTAAPSSTSTLQTGTVWPWSWDYSDFHGLFHIAGHPNFAANFLFVDGHVEPFTRKTVQTALWNTSTNRPVQTFTGAFYP